MGEVVGFAPRAVEVHAHLLWREALGRELREHRRRQSRTLADVAQRAGISTQYLSEIERGLKDPSSEILEAVNGALGLTLVDLTAGVTEHLAGPAAPAPAPAAPQALALAV